MYITDSVFEDAYVKGKARTQLETILIFSV